MAQLPWMKHNKSAIGHSVQGVFNISSTNITSGGVQLKEARLKPVFLHTQSDCTTFRSKQAKPHVVRVGQVEENCPCHTGQENIGLGPWKKAFAADFTPSCRSLNVRYSRTMHPKKVHFKDEVKGTLSNGTCTRSPGPYRPYRPKLNPRHT